MNKKSYADICLERAEKATQGPWAGSRDLSTFEVSQDNEPYTEICHLGPEDSLTEEHNDKVFSQRWYNTEFIAHSRTDVPELARRLTRAIEELRSAANRLEDEHLLELSYKLEALPEGDE